MKKYELEQKIREEVELPKINLAEELWQIPVEKATEDAWFLQEIKDKDKKSNRPKSTFRFALPAMACVSFLLLAFCFVNFQTASVIYLDAKPEISVGINLFDRVIYANALNEDGEKVLENIPVKHQTVEKALDTIVNSMDEKGYFNESQNAVLVSVKSKNEKKEDQIRVRASSEIKKNVDTMEGEHKVYEQTVSKNKKVQEIVEEYQVTPGKATLLEKLVDDNPEQNYETLAGMSIGELEEKLKGEGILLENYANVLEDTTDNKSTAPEEKKETSSDQQDFSSSGRKNGTSHSSGGKRSEKKNEEAEEQSTSEEYTGEESDTTQETNTENTDDIDMEEKTLTKPQKNQDTTGIEPSKESKKSNDVEKGKEGISERDGESNQGETATNLNSTGL